MLLSSGFPGGPTSVGLGSLQFQRIAASYEEARLGARRESRELILVEQDIVVRPGSSPQEHHYRTTPQHQALRSTLIAVVTPALLPYAMFEPQLCTCSRALIVKANGGAAAY